MTTRSNDSHLVVSLNGGFPQQLWGFPTKNDQHLGCEMGVSPFKETTHLKVFALFSWDPSLGFPPRESPISFRLGKALRQFWCLQDPN